MHPQEQASLDAWTVLHLAPFQWFFDTLQAHQIAPTRHPSKWCKECLS